MLGLLVGVLRLPLNMAILYGSYFNIVRKAHPIWWWNGFTVLLRDVLHGLAWIVGNSIIQYHIHLYCSWLFCLPDSPFLKTQNSSRQFHQWRVTQDWGEFFNGLVICLVLWYMGLGLWVGIRGVAAGIGRAWVVFHWTWREGGGGLC